MIGKHVGRMNEKCKYFLEVDKRGFGNYIKESYLKHFNGIWNSHDILVTGNSQQTNLSKNLMKNGCLTKLLLQSKSHAT